MQKERVVSVFGVGTFGLEVCRGIAAQGGKVIAVDNREKAVDKVKDIVMQAIVVDSTDEEALRNAGIADSDVAIVTMADDIQGSILTTAILKNMGLPMIIARAGSDLQAQVLKRIGATEVINIEIEEGKRLAKRLIAPNVLDIIPVSKDYAIAEIRVPRSCVGKSLLELDFRKSFNVNIIIIKRNETNIDDMGNPVKTEVVVVPKPTDILNVDDALLVLGTEKDIDKLKDI